MEKELLRSGSQIKISLWGDIILEGFTQYELCCQNNLPISSQRIPVQNRHEAISWACAAQLRRDDLPEEMRTYLIGKRYSVEKGVPGRPSPHLSGTQSILCEQNTPDHMAIKTAIWLGMEYHLSRSTVTRYAVYASAIDQLSHIAPHLAAAILSGQLKLTRRAVIRLAQLPDEELRYADSNPHKYFVGTPQYRRKRGRPLLCAQTSHAPSSAVMLVKQMPDYDPDADISGLTLTIPSWISSIKRTHSVARLPVISCAALGQLSKQLSSLVASAEVLLAAIKEVL